MIKGRGIADISQTIIIKEQFTKLTYTAEALMRKQVMINTFNANTGEPLSNVLLRLKKHNSKISSEGLTKDGSFTYVIDAN